MKRKLLFVIQLLIFSNIAFPVVCLGQSHNSQNAIEKNLVFNSKDNLTGMIDRDKYRIPDQTHSYIQILDSVYYWRWNSVGAVWRPDYKIININYDVNNNKSSEVYQGWNLISWGTIFKDTFIYDSNSNLTSQLRQILNNTVWVNNQLINFMYDASNNMTSASFQLWTSGAWKNDIQYIFTYDASNNLLSELKQTWNGNAWDDIYRYNSTYNVNNNQTYSLREDWILNSWLINFQDTFIYDVNNILISRLEQSWTGSAWTDSYQFFYTYDSSHNLTILLQQHWNGNAWEKVDQTSYTYDSDNFTTSTTYSTWDINGTVLTGSDSVSYYFHLITGINDVKALDDDILIFPNPAKELLVISHPSSGNKKTIVIISDVTGKIIYTTTTSGSESIEVYISNFTDGIYFVKIQTPEFIETKKIIITK